MKTSTGKTMTMILRTCLGAPTAPPAPALPVNPPPDPILDTSNRDRRVPVIPARTRVQYLAKMLTDSAVDETTSWRKS